MTEFHWDHPGLHSAQFHALASLLTLRNGGQAEQASTSRDLLDDEYAHDDESDAESVNTCKVRQLSHSGHEKLKKKFLDCLAELAANQRSARTVACTAMNETEESVTIWISRNDGFNDSEKPLFERLSEFLCRLSSDGENIDSSGDDLMWHNMIAYHETRIRNDYVPNLRLSFKAFEAAHTDQSQSAQYEVPEEVQNLRDLLFSNTNTNESTTKRNGQLVEHAYQVRMAPGMMKALERCSSIAQSKIQRLWTDICWLSRLRVAYLKFIEIARKLPSFANVSIILIPRAAPSVSSNQQHLNLNQTFDVLKIPLNDVTVQKVVGRKKNVGKIRAEFNSLQSQRRVVHAEVQMLLHLGKSQTRKVFPYFGCSKLACFMCFHLLQSYGKYSMRGCHGRLFKPWTVPNTGSLATDMRDRLVSAIQGLQRKLSEELLSTVSPVATREKTSAIGGSSIAYEFRQEGIQRRSEIERNRLKSEHQRVAGLFQRTSRNEESSIARSEPATDFSNNSQPTIDENSSSESGFDECSTCGRMTNRRCSLCNKGFYCSQKCEDKRSWPHLFECTKRALTTADYLWDCIGRDEVPDDDDVLEDFYFNQFTSFADRCKLLGLYKGLWLSHCCDGSDMITAEHLHQWRVQKTLVAHIKEYFYAIPEGNRGGYFPWFLKHTHLFEKEATRAEATERLVATFYDHAREYLDEEDRQKQVQDLQPSAKQNCFVMLAMATHMLHPHPMQPFWYHFGFCTCRGKHEENRLGGFYNQLLVGDWCFEDIRSRSSPQKATFTEFWRAYEAGALFQLMASHGFESDNKHLKPFLEAGATGAHPSVWDLKQFVAVNDPVEYPPCAPIKVDYGFMNCQNFEETCILLEIYKRLLQAADPLDLHDACLKGKLYEFAQSFHDMEEGHRHLMTNIYASKKRKGVAVGLVR